MFFLNFQRHLGLYLHFLDCKQNDVWPEKLIEELSHVDTIQDFLSESGIKPNMHQFFFCIYFC